jgi:hypothetical protein
MLVEAAVLAEVAERLEHAARAIEQLVPLIAERQRMVLADALVEINDDHRAQLLAALDRITDAVNVATRALGRTSVD